MQLFTTMILMYISTRFRPRYKRKKADVILVERRLTSKIPETVVTYIKTSDGIDIEGIYSVIRIE